MCIGYGYAHSNMPIHASADVLLYESDCIDIILKGKLSSGGPQSTTGLPQAAPAAIEAFSDPFDLCVRPIRRLSVCSLSFSCAGVVVVSGGALRCLNPVWIIAVQHTLRCVSEAAEARFSTPLSSRRHSDTFIMENYLCPRWIVK